MKTFIRVIKIILLISWMIVIFLFSNQVGEESKVTSGILNPLVEIVFKSEKSQDNAKFVIRKIAHFTEYFILSFLILMVLKDYFDINYKMLILVVLLSFLYACSDEYHQSLVDDRSGNMIDVLIDTGGSLFFILIYNIRKFNNEEKELLKDV